jgi:hypothetical protein
LWYSRPVWKKLDPFRQYSSYRSPQGQSLLTQQFLPTDIGNDMFWGDVMEPDDEVYWLAILLHIPQDQR